MLTTPSSRVTRRPDSSSGNEFAQAVQSHDLRLCLADHTLDQFSHGNDIIHQPASLSCHHRATVHVTLFSC